MIPEYVYVEFVAKGRGDSVLLMLDIESLPREDFILHTVDDVASSEAVKITGKINSQLASIIKMRYPFLAERMRVSYISDSLKDKYRT